MDDFSPYQSPQSYAEVPRLDENAVKPAAVTWYKVYAGFMTGLYLILALVGVLLFAFGSELADAETDEMEFRIMGAVYGVLGFFFEGLPVIYMFGGGPMLSVGDPDLQFTVGTVAYGLGMSPEDGDDEILQMIYPHVGGSVRVADIVKLNLEFGPPLLGYEDEWLVPGEIWTIFYGVRIHGERVYGDVGFVIPASEAWFDSIAKYMPVGLPLLMFGYSG